MKPRRFLDETEPLYILLTLKEMPNRTIEKILSKAGRKRIVSCLKVISTNRKLLHSIKRQEKTE